MELLKPFLLPIDVLLSRFPVRITAEKAFSQHKDAYDLDHLKEVLTNAEVAFKEIGNNSLIAVNIHRLQRSNLNPF